MPFVLYHINYVVAVVLLKTNDLILRKNIKPLERFLLKCSEHNAFRQVSIGFNIQPLCSPDHSLSHILTSANHPNQSILSIQIFCVQCRAVPKMKVIQNWWAFRKCFGVFWGVPITNPPNDIAYLLATLPLFRGNASSSGPSPRSHSHVPLLIYQFQVKI